MKGQNLIPFLLTPVLHCLSRI